MDNRYQPDGRIIDVTPDKDYLSGDLVIQGKILGVAFTNGKKDGLEIAVDQEGPYLFTAEGDCPIGSLVYSEGGQTVNQENRGYPIGVVIGDHYSGKKAVKLSQAAFMFGLLEKERVTQGAQPKQNEKPKNKPSENQG